MRNPNDIDPPAGENGAGEKTVVLPPEAVLDVAHLDSQVIGDEALRSELLRLYAGRLIALAPGVCGPPSPQRRDASHALKGASLAIGAFALARICAGIEQGDEEARREAALVIEMTRRRVESVLRLRG